MSGKHSSSKSPCADEFFETTEPILLIRYERFFLSVLKMSWRWPAPDQPVWFPVLALTIRPGLGLARTVAFLYDQPLVSGWPVTNSRLVSH